MGANREASRELAGLEVRHDEVLMEACSNRAQDDPGTGGLQRKTMSTGIHGRSGKWF